MTPKKKAWELYNKYRTLEGKFGDKVLYNYDAKQCALIAVDEILESIQKVFVPLTANLNSTYIYWQEVKQEIQKL